MLSLIEQTILNDITGQIDGLRAAGIQKDAQGLLARPAVAVACLDGTFAKVSNTTYNQQVTVSILVTFKDMRNEEARRKGINPLVQAIIGLLTMKNYEQGFTHLVPVRYADVTTTDDYEAGQIKYLIQFSTSFTITKLDNEAVTDLLRVGLTYYLQPGDQVADASDTVTLEGAQ